MPKYHEIDFSIVLRAEFKGFLEEYLYTPPASCIPGFRYVLLLETILYSVHCTIEYRGRGYNGGSKRALNIARSAVAY